VANESRSAFAAHFASAMHEPPMTYLARFRMFRARALLRQTKLSVDAIADLVGYASAAAFRWRSRGRTKPRREPTEGRRSAGRPNRHGEAGPRASREPLQ
jgi:transcriptional regulator GlxA family with amidase domain